MSYNIKKTMNEVKLIGCLGKDAELKYTPSGAAVATISVATTTGYKDQSGEKHEQTQWHRVVAWRKLAEIVGQYCHKGDRVYVSGRLETRSWDQNGEKRYATEVIAEEIQNLSDRHDESGADGGIPPQQPPQPGRLPRADANRAAAGAGAEYPEPPADDLPF